MRALLPAHAPSPRPIEPGVRYPRCLRAALLLLTLSWQPGGAAEPLTASQRRAEHAGTILQYAIPASALLATWVLEPEGGSGEGGAAGNWLLLTGPPRHDLLLSLGRAWVVTKSLKYTVDETRPDGGSHSFPSGHTSMAFTGAEFIRKQYGTAWGAPAYLAAGFVAWSRVEANRHYTHDVLAGAAIGILANHDFWRWQGAAGSAHIAPAALASQRALVPGVQFELVR
jgi:membrane-associated phospholipid phosphatase